MSPCIIMFSYPNDGRGLKRLILAILKQGLAKCVQRINYMKSYYIREGKLTNAEEKLVLCKTTQDKKDALMSFVRKMHPYDVPEILVLDNVEADSAYMEWLMQDEKLIKKGGNSKR